MSLQLLTLDFETFYDTANKYGLKTMTPEEYIRDERFHITQVGLKFNNNPAFWITGTHAELHKKLSQIDWSQVLCIGHNMSAFDSLILSEVLGFQPKAWGCTLAMGRALHGGESVSLGALAKKYGFRPKGDYLNHVNGLTRDQIIAQGHMNPLGDYCVDDVEICHGLFHKMVGHFPANELRTIHLFTRMFAEPRLELDAPLLRHLGQQIVRQKQVLLAQSGLDQDTLRSDAKFAEVLRMFGIEPGMKWPKKDQRDCEALEEAGENPQDHGYKRKYAFAKTDPFMSELANDPDERVQTLHAARVKNKTTIEESRVARFEGIATRGKLPALFLYGKTQTHRAAGGGKINLQNNGRPRAVTDKTLVGTLLATHNGLRTFDSLVDDRFVNTREGSIFDLKEKDGYCHELGLRDAIRAPKGYKIVVRDSSNIELRVCHLLAGQMDTIERVRQGEDLYCWFATDLYGRTITKGDKKERQHGKVAMLQLQFQSAEKSFQTAARVMGNIHVSLDDSILTKQMFRGKFREIPKLWYRCQDCIAHMHRGDRVPVDRWGLCTTEKNAIVLPNGMRMHYKNLRIEQDERFGDQWVFDDKETRKPKKLYGGALVENIVQALARIIVFDQTLTIESKWAAPGEGVVMIVHDEVVNLVREDRAQAALDHMAQVMDTSPSWWPDLPLNSEGDIADTYGAAK